MLVFYNRFPDDGPSWPETCGTVFVKNSHVVGYDFNICSTVYGTNNVKYPHN